MDDETQLAVRRARYVAQLLAGIADRMGGGQVFPDDHDRIERCFLAFCDGRKERVARVYILNALRSASALRVATLLYLREDERELSEAQREHLREIDGFRERRAEGSAPISLPELAIDDGIALKSKWDELRNGAAPHPLKDGTPQYSDDAAVYLARAGIEEIFPEYSAAYDDADVLGAIQLLERRGGGSGMDEDDRKWQQLAAFLMKSIPKSVGWEQLKKDYKHWSLSNSFR